MIKKIIFSTIFVCIFLLNSITPCHALLGPTHADINEYIAYHTLDGVSLNEYLINTMGFQSGIQESINSYKIWRWLREGGEMEDSPIFRSLNHFHNPIHNEGLHYLIDNHSLIEWSQLPAGEQAHQWFNALGGWKAPYSWFDVRGYFYSALTATDKTTRDDNFAKTFRGLGQLMHLIQDASVPQHTRLDPHPFAGKLYDDYEQWVNNYFTIDDNISPIFFDYSKMYSINYNAPITIANLVDMNMYWGEYPDPSETLKSEIGLSEYSNANFYTRDTMYSYPYPKFSECIGYKEDGKFYLESNGTGQKVKHLVRVGGALGILRYIFVPEGENNQIPVILDDNCHRDYAELLIPRAIGYSSQLLKYFFRGKIEISAPEAGTYSLIDGSVFPQQFTYIKANLRNNTSQGTDLNGNTIYETMGSGTLIAVAKYKKRTDYEEDLSSDPPYSWDREDEFSYSLSIPIEISSLDSSSATEFTFDFSGNPIPAGITDLYLQVIFKGTLGNETDNAIAVGMKDLNEPMHYTESNNDDRVYLDHVLRTADEIRGDETLTARAEEGEIYSVIDPHNINTKIAFYSSNTTPTYYNVTFNSLAPGTYGRLILISDTEGLNMLIHREWTSPFVSYNNYFQISSGVINQMISDIEFHNTNVSSFRGVIQHVFHGHVFYFPDNTEISTAPWPEMTGDPVAATTITP